jgi:hypothetical protein
MEPTGSGGTRRRAGLALTAAATAMMLVSVAAPPAAAGSAPVVTPDTLTLASGGSATVQPLANDSDPDGGPLTLDFDPASVPAGQGSATAAPDGTITFTAAAGFVGSFVVPYRARDGEGLAVGSTITVTVTAPPNRPPVALPDTGTVVAGGQVTIDPRGNDTDPDGDPLSLLDASVASGSGSVVVAASGLVITGTAPGTLVVAYRVADGRGGTASSTVTVSVRAAAPPPNRAPVVAGEQATVGVGRTITVRVLANDRDPDGDRLRLAKVHTPSKGSAKRVGSAIRFRAPKSAGTVRVRYAVADSRGARAKGVLTITVTATPKPSVPTGGAAPTRRQVEAALARLRMPGGAVDGRYDVLTRRAVCAWRTVTGRPASRALPTRAESAAIVATDRLPGASAAMVTGVNVSITCQAVFWVGADRSYRRVMAGTTGIPSRYATRLGVHRIFITHRVWRTSTIYPEARMYKPMQFSGGQAIHGSATDRLVKPYPASHGCVRMLHRDIDALQAGGVGNGTQVRVFGRW